MFYMPVRGFGIKASGLPLNRKYFNIALVSLSDIKDTFFMHLYCCGYRNPYYTLANMLKLELSVSRKDHTKTKPCFSLFCLTFPKTF